MKNTVTTLAFLFAMSQLVSGQAGSNNAVINNNIFLQGQYVEVGIAQCGVFGTTQNQPAGYHGNVSNYLGFVADPDKDGWTTGNPAYNGDYFLPGSPEEGWGIEVGGSNYGNFGQCGTYNIPMTSVSTWMENTKHYAEWNGSIAGVDIRQEVSFEDDETYFFIQAELTNTTGSPLYNTYYMRNVDPDNERMWSGGSYTTINSIVYQPGVDPCDRALVSATGQTYGMYLGLAAVDPRARVTHGGFSNRDASNIYDGIGFNQSGTATDDAAISISFKIDTIMPGETVRVYYSYILDQSQVGLAIGGLTRLLANGSDITNTLVHASCQEPIVLEIVNAEAFSWSWSPSTYLSTNTGPTVICDAPPGTYSYSAVGTNACGNTNTYNFSLEIAEDNEQPLITCRPDTVAGECDNPLSLLPPTATDNCNIESLTHDSPHGVSSTDASGSYPVGVHTIRWTAVDFAGNSAFCNQTITVNASPVAPVSSNESYTYGANALVSATPLANHSIHWYQNADLSDVPVSSSSLDLGILHVGSYTRYATQESNITGCESPATMVQITISARALEITADDKSRVYGVVDPALTWQITTGSLVGTDALAGALARVAGDDVGDYAIQQGTLDAGSDYTMSFVEGTLTIATAALEVTGDALSKIYGAADPALSYSISGGALVGADLISGALSRVSGEDVGAYAIQQGTLTAGTNYSLTYIDGALTIGTAAIEVTADDQSRIYGEADPALSWQITSGALVGVDAISGALARVSGEDVGSYAIEQGTLSAGSNYNLTFVEGALTISQVALVVSADDRSKIYGEADPALTWQITSGALVGADVIGGALVRVAGEDVGNYAIEQGTLSAGSNYSLSFVEATLTVSQASLEVTADDQSRIYGQADPAFTWQITSGALVGVDVISGVLSRALGEDVGSYAIQQGTLSAGSNYALSFVEGSMSITTAALEVSGDALSKIYGAADPALSYTISSGALVGVDAISGSLSRLPGEDVGSYAIQQGTLTAGTNYSLTYIDGTLTIGTAALEVTGDALSKVYGQVDPALSWQITSGALVGIDAISGALSRAPGEVVGSYAIEQGTLTAGTNYSLTYIDGALTIGTVALEVTGDALSKIYGQVDPALSYTISGGALVGVDVISGVLTRAPGEDVGNYAIQQGTLTAGTNYALTYIDGTLTIGTAAIEVTGDDQSRIYGQVDPALSYTITGGALVGVDVISGALTRVAGEDVGAYAIEQGTLTAGTNYSLTFIDGTFAIGTAALEVSGDALSKIYGEVDPALSYTITGGALVGVDVISGALARVAGEDVGAYAIEQGTLTAGTNYALTYIDGTLTIGTAALEVSGDALSKIYGEVDPALSYTITGGALVGVDAISGALTRVVGEDVGAYAIEQGTLTAGTNYTLTYIDGTLTIGTAALEVSGDALSKIYGEVDPALSYSITGGALVGVDAISGALTRVAGEDVGAYSIEQGTLTAGTNYTLTYIDGTLTIGTAALEVTGDALSKIYGEVDPALSYIISAGALVGVDAISGALTRVAGEDVGAYAIEQGTLTAGTNYSLTFIDGTLTIGTAALEVTGDALSKIYGEVDPALGYTITGGALVGVDALSGALVRALGEDAGSYAIEQGTLSAGTNYALTFLEGSLSISQAALAVSADDLGKFFGEVDPTLSWQITSGALVGLDAISGELSRVPGENVGIYAIDQGTLSAGSNYLITFTAGAFTIIIADVQVIADKVTKVYGEDDPILSYTVVDGTPEEIELITGELSREPGEDVGSYLIVKGELTGGDNLNLSFVGDTFTISQAPLELTADDLWKSYGEDDPALTYSITLGSLADGDVIAGMPERDAGEITASYAIGVGGLDAGANYSMSFIGGQFTIDKAVLTVTADDQSKLYGEENPALSYSYSGFAFDENEAVLDTLPLISTDADLTSEAGTYPIILSGGADNNYSFMLVEGVLSIQKTTLTLTAEDKERVYGEENPEFTFTITGFANGEDLSFIDTLPLGSASADLTTDAGSYPIIFSGGFDNKYDFSYIDGTLLIQKAIQVITFEDIPEGLRMTEEYSLIASSNAGLPVSFSSSDMNVAAVDVDVLMILMAETATITAFNEGDQNWYPAEASQDISTLPTFDNITSLFTPNGDGINDFWYIPHMADMGRVQVQVFNRYGNLVYESDEYTNDWDGKWKNKALPEGAYYYIMETELSGLIKGVVNIVR